MRSTEWEPVSGGRTQRKVVLLTTAQIRVPWGHNDSCDHSWPGSNFIVPLTHPHVTSHAVIMKPIPQMKKSLFHEAEQRCWAGPSCEIRLVPSAPVMFPATLCCPACPQKPMKLRKAGRGGWGRRADLQPFISGSAGLKSWGQLGEGLMILLILKMKLLYIRVHRTPANF